ncbi:Detected protein of confused Function [Hibiscus syriacus]|uniref:Detected protein of confused Function n=1 Tax=Hibiscus syriacus TaxID=106335 RepID=A0A6A3BPK5_HIBSY|nr:Detected protein of confused Function [Hibiscus syriacus]
MDFKSKKGKKTAIYGSSSSSRSWSFGDPEFKRKKSVASNKMYGAEGKVKGSLKRSFRWLKDKYTRVVHGSCW